MFTDGLESASDQTSSRGDDGIMVIGPSAHRHSENYHPENAYAKFLEEHGSKVQYCPFVELVELCGEMAGLDVRAIGLENDKYCGSVTPAYPHESGSVFMTCQKVAIELATRLSKLEAEPVTDEEITRLREMTPAERQGVVNRLGYADERKEIVRLINETYGKQFPHQSLHTEAIEWAKERLAELQEKATGPLMRWRQEACPQAPRDRGPMIRY